jgi:hypothetical protein
MIDIDGIDTLFFLTKKINKKMKKSVDNILNIWYIINALVKRRCK